MGFDLGDYVEVKDRIAQFKTDYPDGRLTSEIIPTGFDGFVCVKAYAYRTPDDPVPGTGLAWEPVPGQTPYTKNSELQNAETSAWGRALIAALVADSSQGVASANEVRNRSGGQASPSSSMGNANPAPLPNQENYTDGKCPTCKSGVWDNRFDAKAIERNWPRFKCRDTDCGWKTWDENFFDPAPVREDYKPGDVPEGLGDDWDLREGYE